MNCIMSMLFVSIHVFFAFSITLIEIYEKNFFLTISIFFLIFAKTGELESETIFWNWTANHTQIGK